MAGAPAAAATRAATLRNSKMPDLDWDCADLAAVAIREKTGRDIWAELGPRPTSVKSRAALYRKLKVTSFAAVITKVLGQPIDPKLAMRGDIAMVDNALGVVRGEWVECIDRMQPLQRATKAWRAAGRPKRRAHG